MNPDPSFELLTAASGDLTARKYSGDGSYRFLHSGTDPKKEAGIWTGSQHIIMPHFVIMGLGLAYHVFELLKSCGNIENAYLIEEDESIFQLALMIHDFSDIIRNPAVQLLVGYPLMVIEKILAAALITPFSCHIFSPITSMYPDTYNPLIEFLEKHLCALRLIKGDGGVKSLLNQMMLT
jgi:hypothetical protein